MMLLAAALAWANEDGKSGAAISGCTCHGAPSQNTRVEIIPDATEVDWGGVVNFSIVVNNAGKAVAGFTSHAEKGMLTAGDQSAIERDDAVQPVPVAFVDDQATFSFRWTAPDEDADVVIYTAGNAGNDDGDDQGDEWNWGDNMSVRVGLGDPDEDTGPTDTGDDPTGCEGCNTGGSGIGGLALISMLIRRR